MRFITERTEFERVTGVINAQFRLENRLPDPVPQQVPQATAFFEFDEIFSEEFWQALQQLARHYRDEELYCVVVDPDAERYFRKHFGHFGAFVLPVSLSGSAYLDLLAYEPPDSPADSLLYNSRVVTFSSPSRGFAIWAERGLGLGLLCLYDTAAGEWPDELPQQISFFGVARAIELLGPVFPAQRVPSEVSSKLIANYS